VFYSVYISSEASSAAVNISGINFETHIGIAVDPIVKSILLLSDFNFKEIHPFCFFNTVNARYRTFTLNKNFYLGHKNSYVFLSTGRSQHQSIYKHKTEIFTVAWFEIGIFIL
jgi:hypothetical protein